MNVRKVTERKNALLLLLSPFLLMNCMNQATPKNAMLSSCWPFAKQKNRLEEEIQFHTLTNRNNNRETKLTIPPPKKKAPKPPVNKVFNKKGDTSFVVRYGSFTYNLDFSLKHLAKSSYRKLLIETFKYHYLQGGTVEVKNGEDIYFLAQKNDPRKIGSQVVHDYGLFNLQLLRTTIDKRYLLNQLEHCKDGKKLSELLQQPQFKVTQNTHPNFGTKLLHEIASTRMNPIAFNELKRYVQENVEPQYSAAIQENSGLHLDLVKVILGYLPNVWNLEDDSENTVLDYVKNKTNDNQLSYRELTKLGAMHGNSIKKVMFNQHFQKPPKITESLVYKYAQESNIPMLKLLVIFPEIKSVIGKKHEVIRDFRFPEKVAEELVGTYGPHYEPGLTTEAVCEEETCSNSGTVVHLSYGFHQGLINGEILYEAECMACQGELTLKKIIFHRCYHRIEARDSFSREKMIDSGNVHTKVIDLGNKFLSTLKIQVTHPRSKVNF